VTLLPPLPAHRAGRGWGSAVRIQYHLAEPPAEPLLIEVMDDEGDVIRSWVGKAVPTEPDPDAAPPAADEDDATGATDEDDDEGDDEGELPEDAGRAPAETGMNLLRWNLRYPSATGVPGAMMWSASNVGPLAPPGTYRVRLTMGETVLDQQIVVKGDPRVETTDAEYAEQFALCQDILAQVERVNTSINRLRDVRDQVRAAMRRVEGRDGAETVDELGSAIVEALGDVEEHLIQTRLEAPQDMLNFPIRLNNKIASLMGVVEGDYAPTAQAYDVFESLVERIDERLEALQAILDDRIGPFNEAYAAAAPPAVVVNTGGE